MGCHRVSLGVLSFNNTNIQCMYSRNTKDMDVLQIAVYSYMINKYILFF